MRPWASVLAGLLVGAAAARTLQQIVPAGLALRPHVDGEYRLASYGAAGRVPLVRRLEDVARVLPTAPVDEAWKAAARRSRDLVEIEPGTSVQLIRVDTDAVNHLAMRVRVLDGPEAGARFYASRWHLHDAEPDPLVPRLPADIGAVAGLAAAAIVWAALTLLVGRRI